MEDGNKSPILQLSSLNCSSLCCLLISPLISVLESYSFLWLLFSILHPPTRPFLFPYPYSCLQVDRMVLVQLVGDGVREMEIAFCSFKGWDLMFWGKFFNSEHKHILYRTEQTFLYRSYVCSYGRSKGKLCEFQIESIYWNVLYVTEIHFVWHRYRFQ